MRQTRFLSATAALLIAACGRSSGMDEAMKRDLESASSGGIELAPRGPAMTVVSPLESGRPVQPKVTPARRVVAPTKRTAPVTKQVTQSSAETAPAAVRPLPASSVSAPPPGGYKSIGEVLRGAPFPIKP
ncbi:MAG TPA: hypothetical protein VFT29_08830 [Gemmatimonadaceae bacterium]|nr:hypothetical protein [Gemmatimonadaceae bacterium]